MAFKLIRQVGGQTEASAYEMLGSGEILTGDVVQVLSTQAAVIRANSKEASVTVSTIFAVAASSTAAGASGTTMIKVIPIVSGQLWEADCASNTATNQIMCRNLISSASVVTNSSTNTTTALGVFLVYNYIGAVSDKKVIGEFIRNSSALV